MSVAGERDLEALLEAARERITALEQKVLDYAEDFAMSGIPLTSDLANALTKHYYQRQRDREDAAKWRAHLKEQPPMT